MRARYQRELDILESGLSVLATIGSVSPYIGLFGTVWGIMDAFTGLGNLESASLAVVAPGIAEALVATAIGLFAAYSLDRLSSQYESFMQEFQNILGHQAQGRNMARNGKRRLLAEMNVVPYIDVMLVLVVILMVAAPYVNPSIVDLPKVNKAARTPDKVVEVIISPDGKLQIRDTAKKLTPVDFPQLVSTVESMQTDGAQVPVVIAADKTVAYEKVIDVMRNLQKANITRIGLSLQLEGSGAK